MFAGFITRLICDPNEVKGWIEARKLFLRKCACVLSKPPPIPITSAIQT